MGKRSTKFTLEEERTSKKSRKVGEVKSAKILTYFPELKLTEKQTKGESTERKSKVDPVSMAMKYKKKRFSAAS